MQELEPKLQGGLIREGGGVFAGFYGTCSYRSIRAWQNLKVISVARSTDLAVFYRVMYLHCIRREVRTDRGFSG